MINLPPLGTITDSSRHGITFWGSGGPLVCPTAFSFIVHRTQGFGTYWITTSGHFAMRVFEFPMDNTKISPRKQELPSTPCTPGVTLGDAQRHKELKGIVDATQPLGILRFWTCGHVAALFPSPFVGSSVVTGLAHTMGGHPSFAPNAPARKPPPCHFWWWPNTVLCLFHGSVPPTSDTRTRGGGCLSPGSFSVVSTHMFYTEGLAVIPVSIPMGAEGPPSLGG
jgi:hypothetical protein